MNPLRIALLNLHRGGMQHYTAWLANSLRAAAPDARVACFCAAGSAPGLFDPAVARFEYPVPQAASLAALPAALRAPFVCGALQRAVLRWRPDILHANSGHLYYPLFLPRLARRLPLVATIHDAAPHPGERRPLEGLKQRSLFRHSRLIFVHSEAVRQSAAGRWPYPADRLRLMPLGLTAHLRRWAFGRPEHPADILFFGRIVAYKGLDVLLAALPAVAERIPATRLTIAGEGDLSPWRPALCTQRRRIRILNRFIPDEEVAPLFEEAAVVALPYHEATQSGVALLAAAFGKPVVASAVGSNAAAVAHGETGLLVPAGDSAALAAAVRELLGDPERRRALGRAAADRVAADAAGAAAGRLFLEAYGAALEKPRT
jgi:glycosyltransferase involved in cell wall biosynthesis